MEKLSKLNEFKKEFEYEIGSKFVSVQNLKNQKVSSSVLEAECFLRKVFGDEIYTPKKFDEQLVGEKEVVKLSDEDVAFDAQVREICDNLASEEFDTNVTLIISHLNIEED